MNKFAQAARYILRCRIKRADSIPLGPEQPKVSEPIPTSSQDVLKTYNLSDPPDVPITGKYFVPKGMNYIEPGVYVVNSGLLPFKWAYDSGFNNGTRHSLAATIHDTKPPVKNPVKLPNGQWATYYSSTSGDGANGQNFPVWNGVMGGTKGEEDHYGNDYILTELVKPHTIIPNGKSRYDASYLKPSYQLVLPGSDNALKGSLTFEDLYKRNHQYGYGPYSILKRNHCIAAAAHALANIPGMSTEKIPPNVVIGSGAGIPASKIMEYKNLGRSATNSTPTLPHNPAIGELMRFPVTSPMPWYIPLRFK